MDVESALPNGAAEEFGPACNAKEAGASVATASIAASTAAIAAAGNSRTRRMIFTLNRIPVTIAT